MSRLTIRGTRCLAIVALVGAAANAQQPTLSERAPVPRQVLAAKAAFVGNGGSETYGADSYFDLTKYDGGPNRAYDEFYKALQDWGYYDLVGSTSDADVLLVIRFTNPVVNRGNSETTGDVPHDWIRDPQLNLAINDPRSGLTLWSLTEHIEPGGGKADANRHFDEAVGRLVDDLRRLILHPEDIAERESIALPPGAIAAAQRQQRERHAGLGLLIGGLAGGVAGMQVANTNCTDFTDLHGCFTRGESRARDAVLVGVAGMVAGALIGWVWPVSY
jgi:hypothetical protein